MATPNGFVEQRVAIRVAYVNLRPCGDELLHCVNLISPDRVVEFITARGPGVAEPIELPGLSGWPGLSGRPGSSERPGLSGCCRPVPPG